MNPRWTWLLIFAGLAGAQNPADVTLTLAPKDGRTQFRKGEAIELLLQFQSSAPGKYGVWTLNTDRLARKAEYDEFTVEPAGGTADPLANGGAQFAGRAHVGPPPAPVKIESGGATVSLFLNEWISFRKPGQYRVTADTTRLVAMAMPENRLPMHSSTIEIEIVPAEPGWADAQLKQAVARLGVPDPPPGRIGQRGPSFEEMKASEESARYAGRVVRFLETPEAARVLARYLGRAPMYAEDQLRAGLVATPYRKELIAAMYDIVAAPDQPIVQDLYFGLRQFAEIAALGPAPDMPESVLKDRDAMRRWMQEVQMPYHQRAEPIDDEVTARMVAALANKRGDALAISLATLGGTGPNAPPPALSKLLLANFASLPENTQHLWLTSEWPRIAAPEAEPVVRELAAGKSDLRDAALIRLFEFNPAAARTIAIDRIRRGDASREVYHDDRALLTLPDKTLPELDGALAENFERGLWHSELLLARYGPPAIAERVKVQVERGNLCDGTTMAYLFRVDPSYASARLAQVRASRPCSLLGMQGSEDLLMSPALEKQLIADMDPAVTRGSEVSGIASLLQNGGTAASKPALIEALNRPVDSRMPPGAQSPLPSIVMTAAGWLPEAEDFERIKTVCGTDGCRGIVDRIRAQLAGPIEISPESSGMPFIYARVGPYMLRSAQQVKDKIAQFPKGTSFYVAVSYPGTWWAEQHTREISQMVKDAGMNLVEPPQRPPHE